MLKFIFKVTRYMNQIKPFFIKKYNTNYKYIIFIKVDHPMEFVFLLNYLTVKGKGINEDKLNYVLEFITNEINGIVATNNTELLPSDYSFYYLEEDYLVKLNISDYNCQTIVVTNHYFEDILTPYHLDNIPRLKETVYDCRKKYNIIL